MSDGDTLETAPQTDEHNVEARARAQGWRPKEEFKGPTERWRPADEFLRAADVFMPVARERNRALESKLDKATGEIADLKQVMSDFREFASRGEQRAYERARSELMAKRDVAVAHADTETFKQVDREITELDKTVPKVEAKRDPPQQPPPARNAVIDEWVAENRWFNSDPTLHAMAKALDAEFERNRPGIDLSERLAAVRAEVQRRFPEKFENPHRESVTAVSAPSGNNGAKRAAKHSYENLPPEAKKACDKFVKSIPGFKVEDYVKDYEWSDA